MPVSFFNSSRFDEPDEQNPVRRPPTSMAAAQMLPDIILKERDFKDEAACPICLAKFTVGDTAVRIPCGHIFHGDCIKEWLNNSNQCAVCRWELPTDDADYERIRHTASQKLRLRIADLQRRTVRELRFLARILVIDLRGCLEKTDIVDCIVASGLIDVAPEEPRQTSVASFQENGRETPREIVVPFQQRGESGASAARGCLDGLSTDSASNCHSIRDVTGSVPRFGQMLGKLLGTVGIARLVRAAPALTDVRSSSSAHE